MTKLLNLEKKQKLKKWIAYIIGGLLVAFFVYTFTFYVLTKSSVSYSSNRPTNSSQTPELPKSLEISPTIPPPIPSTDITGKDNDSSVVISSTPRGLRGYLEHEGKRYDIYDYTPQSNTIKYYSKNSINMKYLSVEINGIPFEGMLDTGASYVAVGPEVIKTIGVRQFKEKRTTKTAGGPVPSYSFTCESVKLGVFEVKNIECSYIPTYSGVLIGGSFLSNFNYSINEEDKTITLSVR